jgi:phosphoribosylanthranilate isomerase
MGDKPIKIKVCGMRDPGNIAGVASLLPDYLGFIYYPKSPRYAHELKPGDISGLPVSIRKTGVFVNSPRDEVLSISRRMGFRTLQLHGEESPDLCRDLKEEGFEIIKVFSIGGDGGFEKTGKYLKYCDLFLFDTASEKYGGTGEKYPWERLQEYSGEKDFFLSGGLAPGDLDDILKIRHPRLAGVDLNSRFEDAPGIKNLDLLARFMEGIRKQSY